MRFGVAVSVQNVRTGFDARYPREFYAVDGLYGIPLEDGYGFDAIVKG